MLSDVEAFRMAWNASAAIVANERPNAKIQVALDRLADGVVSRVTHGSTVDAALKPFAAAIEKGDGMTSDPSSLGATFYRDGDRALVAVHIGYASSVSAYSRDGRLTLPAAMRWNYRQFGPFFRTGTLVAFDATSLSDAGVRYTFRLGFLRRTPQGYASAGVATGASNYDFDDAGSPRLIAKGNRLTVKSLDTPRAFFVSNAERILRRIETWDAGGPVARRVAVKLEDPDLRAVDDWLFAHRGTSLEGKKIPKEPSMAESIERGKGWVRLTLDGDSIPLRLRFDLAVLGKKNVVRKVSLGTVAGGLSRRETRLTFTSSKAKGLHGRKRPFRSPTRSFLI